MSAGRVLWAKADNTAHFERVGPDEWHEIDTLHHRTLFVFTEVGAQQTDEGRVVVLFDAARNLAVRLTPTTVFWGVGRECDVWNVLCAGAWRLGQGDNDQAQEEGDNDQARGEGEDDQARGEREGTDANDDNDALVGPNVSIHVRSMAGFRDTVSMGASSTVRALKARLARLSGVHQAHQHLVHRGQVLVDDVTLAAAGVGEGHTIYLVSSAGRATPAPAQPLPQPLPQQPQPQPQPQQQPRQDTQQDAQQDAQGGVEPAEPFPNPWERDPVQPRAPAARPPFRVVPEQARREDGRQCRICLGGEAEGHLFSPCLCRGTVGLVHVECLNAWRHTSANPHSLVRCDQCGYHYNILRTRFASFLLNEKLTILVSCALLAALVFVTGLLCVALGVRIDLWFYRAVAWSPAWRHLPPNALVFGVLPLWLCEVGVCGGVLCGMGAAALMLYLRCVHDQQFFMHNVLPSVAVNCYLLGMPVMRLIAALGLFVAWRDGAYAMVRGKARQLLVTWGETVLEVHPDDDPHND